MAEAAAQEQERAVGITAFVAPSTPGFQCTIKHRFTDFLVNEILPGGTVQHLLNDREIKEGKQKPDVDSSGGGNGTARSEVDAVGKDGKRKLEESGEPRAEANSGPAKKQKVQGESNGDQAERPNSGTAELHTERKTQVFSSIPEADRITLLDLFGDETTSSILNLYANVIMHPERKPREQPKVQSDVISEKSKRTEIHVAVRKIFNSKLATETMQDQPGVIAIRAAPTKGPSGARGEASGAKNGAYQKGKLGWDELGGEYLHFTLYKENKDTMEVLYFLASQLKIPVKNFQFAGTKDRRGVTVQRVAVKRIYADRMAKLNKISRGWRLGDFQYRKDGLNLAELDGNEFHLTLRDCHVDGEDRLSHDGKVALITNVVEGAAKSFKVGGFLNYYGLQRFGTYSIGSHDTGRKMLKGDLEGAIDSILAYSDHLLSSNVDTSGMVKVPQDDINRADAIHKWKKSGGESADVIQQLPRRFQAESAIMQYLGKKKGGKLVQSSDWQGALVQVPRNLMLIYPHAYQSFVWNHAAGRRWELYGSRVVEGDLVIVGDKDAATSTKDEVDESGEPIFHPAGDDSAPSAEDTFTRARHLTKAEAESGKYDVFDIVLPQPGFDILYPANDIGKYYEEFMASEAGGGLDPHNMRRPWKEISLPGGYRKVLARPGEGLNFEVKSYTHPEEQLVETDLERLQRINAGGEGSNGAHVNKDQMSAGNEFAGEGRIAVVLKMKLGVSQYATMALRELTKGRAVNYKPDYSASR